LVFLKVHDPFLISIDNEEEVNYGIAGGNLGQVFDIDPESGRVFLNASLDFEMVTHYELWVKSFHKTKPLFFKSKMISIEVLDRNDNAPAFEATFVKVTLPGKVLTLLFNNPDPTKKVD